MRITHPHNKKKAHIMRQPEIKIHQLYKNPYIRVDGASFVQNWPNQANNWPNYLYTKFKLFK